MAAETWLHGPPVPTADEQRAMSLEIVARFEREEAASSGAGPAAEAADDRASWLVGPVLDGTVARRVPTLVVGLLGLQVTAAVVVESVVATPW